MIYEIRKEGDEGNRVSDVAAIVIISSLVLLIFDSVTISLQVWNIIEGTETATSWTIYAYIAVVAFGLLNSIVAIIPAVSQNTSMWKCFRIYLLIFLPISAAYYVIMLYKLYLMLQVNDLQATQLYKIYLEIIFDSFCAFMLLVRQLCFFGMYKVPSTPSTSVYANKFSGGSFMGKSSPNMLMGIRKLRWMGR